VGTRNVLKTMTWYLKIAFGQSKILFGGMALDPSMGLVQPPWASWLSAH
jgi:hypothetical protein